MADQMSEARALLRHSGAYATIRAMLLEIIEGCAEGDAYHHQAKALLESLAKREASIDQNRTATPRYAID